ncbi:hypothetical protein FRC12_000472 [Ceratobasidium sp. 428]|nr:hypothetical protein FRC12_000472 [Ceratobasidium sp. 428]
MLTSATYIKRLPTEVLSLIFTIVVNGSLYARYIRDKTYGSFDYPTLLASVCSSWRYVAIGNPKLWSCIDVTDLTREDTDNLKSFKQANLRLERSQNIPLAVHIGNPYADSFFRRLSMHHLPEDIETILISHGSRIQSIALDSCGLKNAVSALALLLGERDYPLTCLALRLEDLDYNKKLLPPRQLSQLLESLHTLYLERASPNLGDLVCCNLVELYLIDILAPITATQLARLLNANPCLCIVKLTGSFSRVLASPHIHKIDLPNLHRLELDGFSIAFTKWFFAALVAGPHSLALCIQFCEGFSYSIVKDISLRESLISFFRRTSIKEFHLVENRLSLPAILPFIPDLQHLGLCLYNLNQSNINFHEMKSAVHKLVKLHTIDLNECEQESYDELNPGLRILLTLPSLRRIRHLNCGGELDEDREKFCGLLSSQETEAQVIRSPELNYTTHPPHFYPRDRR